MDADRTDEPIFDFIFVTASDVERPREIRGLCCESGAIILEQITKQKITEVAEDRLRRARPKTCRISTGIRRSVEIDEEISIGLTII
jgi:hypothetical protein